MARGSAGTRSGRIPPLLVASLMLLLAACTSPGSQAPSPAEATSVAAPVFIATAVPTTSPVPVQTAVQPTPIAPATADLAVSPTAPGTLKVTNTGGQGLMMRREPGGAPLVTLPEGAIVSPLGEEQEAAGRAWRQVQDGTGREGWVAAEFLTADGQAPVPTPAPASSPAPTVPVAPQPSATPTWPVPLIPTATHGTIPVPTRTRAPVGSPAPTGATAVATPIVTPPPLISPGVGR
jgi:hypothetical protein